MKRVCRTKKITKSDLGKFCVVLFYRLFLFGWHNLNVLCGSGLYMRYYMDL